MDSFGNDLGFYGARTIREYKEICEKENCVCFNTLGYIKTKALSEDKLIYLPSSTKMSQGLYVKN